MPRIEKKTTRKTNFQILLFLALEIGPHPPDNDWEPHSPNPRTPPPPTPPPRTMIGSLRVRTPPSRSTAPCQPSLSEGARGTPPKTAGCIIVPGGAGGRPPIRPPPAELAKFTLAGRTSLRQATSSARTASGPPRRNSSTVQTATPTRCSAAQLPQQHCTSRLHALPRLRLAAKASQDMLRILRLQDRRWIHKIVIFEHHIFVK